MVEFKIVIADPKTGKCIQKTAAEDSAKGFMGLKIGDSVKGELLDLTGYEFEITGGSDSCGFPMRRGISGPRKRILLKKGVGFKGGRKGMLVRKTVCGDHIHDKVSQINLKITKYGKKSLDEQGSENAEEAPKEDAPKEGAKE